MLVNASLVRFMESDFDTLHVSENCEAACRDCNQGAVELRSGAKHSGTSEVPKERDQ